MDARRRLAITMHDGGCMKRLTRWSLALGAVVALCGVAPGAAMADGPKTEVIRLQDACDLNSFNANPLTAGGCVRDAGGVSAEEFLGKIDPKDFGHRAWWFNASGGRVGTTTIRAGGHAGARSTRAGDPLVHRGRAVRRRMPPAVHRAARPPHPGFRERVPAGLRHDRLSRSLAGRDRSLGGHPPVPVRDPPVDAPDGRSSSGLTRAFLQYDRPTPRSGAPRRRGPRRDVGSTSGPRSRRAVVRPTTQA